FRVICDSLPGSAALSADCRQSGGGYRQGPGKRGYLPSGGRCNMLRKTLFLATMICLLSVPSVGNQDSSSDVRVELNSQKSMRLHITIRSRADVASCVLQISTAVGKSEQHETSGDDTGRELLRKVLPYRRPFT